MYGFRDATGWAELPISCVPWTHELSHQLFRLGVRTARPSGFPGARLPTRLFGGGAGNDRTRHLATRVNVQLCENALRVMSRRVLADVHLRRDRRIARPARQKERDVRLARRHREPSHQKIGRGQSGLSAVYRDHHGAGADLSDLLREQRRAHAVPACARPDFDLGCFVVFAAERRARYRSNLATQEGAVGVRDKQSICGGIPVTGVRVGAEENDTVIDGIEYRTERDERQTRVACRGIVDNLPRYQVLTVRGGTVGRMAVHAGIGKTRRLVQQIRHEIHTMFRVLETRL